MKATTMSNDVYEIFLRFNNEWKGETDKVKKDKLFYHLTILYNDWCDSCEGYLYDITKEDDICCCIQHGKGLSELAAIEKEFVEFNKTPFFTLRQSSNVRETDIIQFSNRDEVVKFIYERRNEIFEWLVTHTENDYFSYFYENFILPTILNKAIFWNE